METKERLQTRRLREEWSLGAKGKQEIGELRIVIKLLWGMVK